MLILISKMIPGLFEICPETVLTLFLNMDEQIIQELFDNYSKLVTNTIMKHVSPLLTRNDSV